MIMINNVGIKLIIALSIITGFFQISFANDYQNADEKYAVFVVGAGRCGSSCLTGVLKILGVEIGKDFAKPTSNPKGSFEHRGLRQNNYIITKELVDSTVSKLPAYYMFYVPIVDWDTHPKKDIYIQAIKDSLQHVFGTSPLFAFKDPRLSFLLPLYTKAAQELGYTPKIIIMLREPKEIIASFKKMVPEKHHATFDTYLARCLTAILKDINGYDFISIEFNKLLNDTEDTVTLLQNFIPGLKPYPEVIDKLEVFLDKDLKHHDLKRSERSQ